MEAAKCVLVHHNLRQMGEVGGSATKEKEKGGKKKTNTLRDFLLETSIQDKLRSVFCSRVVVFNLQKLLLS